MKILLRGDNLTDSFLVLMQFFTGTESYPGSFWMLEFLSFLFRETCRHLPTIKDKLNTEYLLGKSTKFNALEAMVPEAQNTEFLKNYSDINLFKQFFWEYVMCVTSYNSFSLVPVLVTAVVKFLNYFFCVKHAFIFFHKQICISTSICK